MKTTELYQNIYFVWCFKGEGLTHIYVHYNMCSCNSSLFFVLLISKMKNSQTFTLSKDINNLNLKTNFELILGIIFLAVMWPNSRNLIPVQ